MLFMFFSSQINRATEMPTNLFLNLLGLVNIADILFMICCFRVLVQLKHIDYVDWDNLHTQHLARMKMP